jgi:cytochrome c556
MLRLEEIATYPSEFRHMLEESERSAWFIESMLAFSNDPNLGKIKPDQRDALDVNWKSIRTNCSACHQRFRDQPK